MPEKKIGDEFTGLPMAELVGKLEDCLDKDKPELHCPDNTHVPEGTANDFNGSADNNKLTHCPVGPHAEQPADIADK